MSECDPDNPLTFDTDGNLIEGGAPLFADGSPMPQEFQSPDFGVLVSQVEQTTTMLVRRVGQAGALFDGSKVLSIGGVSAPVGLLAAGALGAALLYSLSKRGR